jgi:hypothetical protein
MSKLEHQDRLIGFAWYDDDTGDLMWALPEDFEGVERPKDATPVIIEITPTNEWVDNKDNEHNLLLDVQDTLNKFSKDLGELEKSLSVDTEI